MAELPKIVFTTIEGETRDLFAALILAAVVARPDFYTTQPKATVEMAVELADALIYRLKETKK